MEAQCNGIKMFYRDAGQGEAFVMLHGFPLDGSMWDRQLEHFQSRYRVIAPDLRGFGRSESSDATSMEQMADDVAALLDRLQIRSAVLAGFSMGGYVAFAFLRKYPERVKALLLANTRAEADSTEGRENRKKMAQSIREKGAAAAAEAMVPKLFAPHTFEQNRELVRQVESVILRMEPKGLIAATLAMAERQDSTPDLAGIRVPVLVIGGDQDAVIPVDVSTKMAERIPAGRYAEVKGAGHLSNMEQPEQFNIIAQEWLDKLQN